MVDSTPQNSLTQMAEDIFNLTKMSWRERLASRPGQQDEISEAQFLALDAISRAGKPHNVGDLHRAISVLRMQKTLHLLAGLSEQDRADFNRICRHIRDLYANPDTTATDQL
ncbi:MAG: hypothetical protein HKL95_05035 [Phycisphaerae bacterium]|nr:hypothetical protein [Phycisphaerae bacterium]